MKKIFITLTMSLIAISVFGQTKETVEARIWKTESFCNLPESANVPSGVIYSNTFIYGICCDSLNKENYTGVWITFEGKDVDTISMKSHYENISLVCKDTKEILHPTAYMGSGYIYKNGKHERGASYNSRQSTMEECKYPIVPKEKYDLFIIFEKAQAGDRIIMEDFLEAEIK